MMLFRMLLSISVCLVAWPVATNAQHPVRGRHTMVVSDDVAATKVGVQILRDGGTAVDAAVAVGFMLAVTYPEAGNLGGGGFMVIRLNDGRTTTIDYREAAPGKATPAMYLDSLGEFVPGRSTVGHLAAGVPGAVAGMLYALEHYGTLSRERILAPAIEAAENGFLLDERQARLYNGERKTFERFPSTKKIFVRPDRPWREGDTLVQKDLAGTLHRIAEQGHDGFYKGPTAALIAGEMERGGGLISLEDLAGYRAIERPPVRGSYRGYEVISMGPASSGGVALLQLLNLVEAFPMASYGPLSSKSISRMVEAMRLVYADRAEYLGDPAFTDIPVDQLVSSAYAGRRRQQIDTMRAGTSASVRHGIVRGNEPTETTHYAVVDAAGDAVSVTTTINDLFGSRVVVDGAGFLLNDEMDDFSAKPGVPNLFGLVGGEANAIKPGKRMLSSMTPTIILRNDSLFLLVGGRGGSRIISSVFQVVVNVLDHRMNVQEAVNAPRIHHQWLPDEITYERRALVEDVRENLRAMGYRSLVPRTYLSQINAILVDPVTGFRFGAPDGRSNGFAAGD